MDPENVKSICGCITDSVFLFGVAWILVTVIKRGIGPNE